MKQKLFLKKDSPKGETLVLESIPSEMLSKFSPKEQGAAQE